MPVLSLSSSGRLVKVYISLKARSTLSLFQSQLITHNVCCHALVLSTLRQAAPEGSAHAEDALRLWIALLPDI